MKLVPSTMMMTSLSAGRYAPPAMQGPITAAICGTCNFAAHQRVVVEDASGSVLAWKNAVLERQIHAGGIDQIDDRHAIAHGDFLRAQNLGDGFRPPCSGFDGGIVGDDDRRPAFDFAEAGDHARGGRLAVISVMRDEQSDFEEHRAGVGELRDSLARGELAVAMLLFDFLRPAALAQPVFELLEAFDELPHAGGAGGGHDFRIQEAGNARD